MKVIKVVLVGMNNLFLQGLRHLLDPAQFSIAAEASDLASWSVLVGEGLAPDSIPDLLLADLNGCSENDLDHVQSVRATFEDIRIVVLANELCLMNMARLLRAGVDGYLLKDVSPRALSLSLLLVMNGEKALPSTLASVLADDHRTEAVNGASIRAQKHLTEREEQILRCLLNAYSNKHIARALNISEGTVKVHLKSLMKKIAAGNRTQAALWARNNGIAHRELMTGRPQSSPSGIAASTWRRSGARGRKGSEMNRNIPVRSGWDFGEVGLRNLGPPSVPTMADTGEIDLRGFFRTIYRRKWMLLSTMGACMGATMLWLSYATPYYDAEVLIVVEARPSSIVRVDERVQDLISDGAEVNTEVAVLESRGLASRVIRDLELDRDPEFTEEAGPRGDPAAGASGAATAGGGVLAKIVSHAITEALNSLRTFLASAWAGVNGADALAPEQREREEPANARLLDVSEGREAAAVLERFLERLTVTPEEESRLIRIAFTSTDPAKAALIANRLVDEYLESQLETKTEGARRAAEWLEVRLAELGKTVRSLEQSVEQQRAETGSNGIDIVSPRLAQINLQLIDAQAASAASRARYEQVRSVVESGGNLDALPEILHSPIVQPLRAKYTELVATLSERRTIFGENHPQIVSLRAEIAGIEQRLARDIGNILAGLRNEMETDKTNEATLRRALEAASEDVVRLKASETAIAQVAQRLQANQDLYRNLLERFTEAVALRDNQQPDARIISPAQIPLDPSFPNFPRFIVLSFVASTSLGLFVLVIAERLRQKLDTVDSVERHVGLPIIGTIPELPRRRRLASSPAGYLQRHPLSEFGGAFQRLRALLNLGRAMPRTVLVTSGSAGEGKTTVAMCLGIASALSGQRVLLVDCNFARPEVHRKANVKNHSGLTDVLRGLVPLEDTITLAAEYHLSILTIGRSREGALDLLNSGRMQELLDELKRIFDVIILDSAPVHEVSNALTLGCLAEKTILVTRREWTKHRDAFYAAKQLQLSGADVAGVVFNRAEP